jgi:hypothetical protein
MSCAGKSGRQTPARPPKLASRSARAPCTMPATLGKQGLRYRLVGRRVRLDHRRAGSLRVFAGALRAARTYRGLLFHQ